jgi:predicted nucleic acid-binding protein
MYFVDTNIFLRYLTRDDEKKAASCRKLLLAAENGEVKLFTSDLVFAELVWVLQSPATYNLKPSEIRDIIMPLLYMKGLKVPSRDIIAYALELFSNTNIDYIDAYHAEILKDNGIKEIYSYDQHFDILPDVVRQEP